jgi:predicted Zn-dependent peptidase
MVEDTPDDLVHELFTQHFWEGHALGRPILGSKETVESFDAAILRDYFGTTYVAPNLIVSAAGNIEHGQVRELVSRAFEALPRAMVAFDDTVPRVVPQVLVRTKELEQSHVCLGTNSYQQNHPDRYVGYIMNTVLGGSMSSRLFQNVREKRGLAYAVFRGLSAYRDAGNLTIYAGCANEAVPEVVDLCVEELRGFKQEPVHEPELRRAKDHLKGSLMLSLGNTASRMSHLARQEISSSVTSGSTKRSPASSA